MNSKQLDCPQCDGEGNHGEDEEGFLYTCYACHGTGVMTEFEAQDYNQQDTK